jgi:hypothetical protein
VSTAANNVSTCVSEYGSVHALPSHPPLPPIVQMPSNGDAFGHDFVPVWETLWWMNQATDLFPDIGVFRTCQRPVAPAIMLESASFLTDTSTSYVSSHPTSKADPPAGPTAQPVSQPPSPNPEATPTAQPASQSPNPLPPAPTNSPAATILGNGGVTAGGQIITANPTGGLVIDGQTLAPGGPAITVSGTPISLAPGATAIVVGSSTMPIIVGDGNAPTVLTVGGQTIMENPGGAFVIGSQTLAPGGPAITVSGTRISLAPGATDIVIGTSTVPILTGVGQYKGPLANGAVRIDCAWKNELLMGACWAVCLGLYWVVSW